MAQAPVFVVHVSTVSLDLGGDALADLGLDDRAGSSDGDIRALAARLAPSGLVPRMCGPAQSLGDCRDGGVVAHGSPFCSRLIIIDSTP